MVPRPLGGLVAISNRLLADAVAENQWSAGSVDDVIKRDIADLIAVTLDNGLINGGSNAPTGILNTTGTTALAGVTIPTNGFSLASPPGGTSRTRSSSRSSTPSGRRTCRSAARAGCSPRGRFSRCET